MKWLKRIALGLILLLIVVAGGAYLYLRASLPQVAGSLQLAGLTAQVEIARDRYGIPRIKATSEADAWFALGFVHAQDRFTQMEMMRRAASGRLAEIFGRAALESDRFMRLLGNTQLANASLAAMSAQSRARLDAYAAGVNAFLGSGATLPPEFLLFGKPEPWTPVDSLLWARLMTLQLTGNWRDELALARIIDRLPTAQIDELWPDRPADSATTIAALDRGSVERLIAALPPPLGPERASNEFVLSGTNTISGKPLLANDPHLQLAAPDIWYLVRIEAPGMLLVGASAPGVPAIVLGHNGRIAWGFTTTNADSFDLFAERADPADPARYQTQDGMQPFSTRPETIRLRGGEVANFPVRMTRHGPVLSDLLPDSKNIFSLSFPAHHRVDRTAEALFNLNRARDWPEFQTALRDFHAPMQNIVYADIDGNIGFIAPGLLPRRKGGEQGLPRPGWSGDFDWDGFAEFDTLPRLFNPANGRIVNANNRIVPDNFPVFVTRDWDSPYRAARIHQLLDSTPRVDSAAAERVMADPVSLFARAALQYLDGVTPADDRSRQAIALLRAWDGAAKRDRPEPLIFNTWMRELLTALLHDPNEPALADMLRERPELSLKALAGNSAFCRDRPGGCAEIVAGSLAASLDSLSTRFGADMGKWRWDSVHIAPFRHPLYDRVPVLRDLFGFRVPTDGDYYTVNRGAGRIGSQTEPFAHTHGAGYRAVYDFADLDRSVFVMTPGQSGHPLSPHWGDLAPVWASGKHVQIPPRAEGGTTLMLQPR